LRLPGELSRELFMAQAANLKDLSLPLLTPGVKLNTSLKTTGRSKIGYMGPLQANSSSVKYLRVLECTLNLLLIQL
jgi:hypothetical protein